MGGGLDLWKDGARCPESQRGGFNMPRQEFELRSLKIQATADTRPAFQSVELICEH